MSEWNTPHVPDLSDDGVASHLSDRERAERLDRQGIVSRVDLERAFSAVRREAVEACASICEEEGRTGLAARMRGEASDLPSADEVCDCSQGYVRGGCPICPDPATQEPRQSLKDAIRTAFLGAVHRGAPCPFCLARTTNVWPWCAHFAPCILAEGNAASGVDLSDAPSAEGGG